MTAALRSGLALLALCALAVFLFGRQCESTAPPAPEEAPEAGPGGPPPDLLAAEAPAGEPAPAPGLLPRPASRRPEPSGPLRVRVLGPGDTPLPGVSIAVVTTRERLLGVVLPPTDGRGETRHDEVPYDGSVRLQVHAPEPWRRAGSFVPSRLPPRLPGDALVTVTGPEVVYRAATGLEVDLRAVSAESGGEVDGVRVRCRKAQRKEGRAWGPAPRRFLMTPDVGSPTTLHWDVEAPRGWVVWERTWLPVTISPYAHALEVVLPLRREMAVTVTTLGPEGTPVPGRIYRARVAGRVPGAWRFEGDAYGRLHLFGIPFLRDEILEVGACRKDLTGPATVRTVIPDHPATPIELQVTLPEDGEIDEDTETIGLGGGAGSHMRGRFHGRKDNALRVTVRRRDGTPAVGAHVSVGDRTARTDASGTVRFTRLRAGRLTVRARQVGLLPIEGRVDVPAQGEARLTLLEGAGGTLELLVRDEDGRPLSFARLALQTTSGQPWIDMRETRQRLDPFTDSLGRRVLHHVEPGLVTVRVTWGSRKGEARVRVVEGETLPVTVVLRRPSLLR